MRCAAVRSAGPGGRQGETHLYPATHGIGPSGTESCSQSVRVGRPARRTNFLPLFGAAVSRELPDICEFWGDTFGDSIGQLGAPVLFLFSLCLYHSTVDFSTLKMEAKPAVRWLNSVSCTTRSFVIAYRSVSSRIATQQVVPARWEISSDERTRKTFQNYCVVAF